MTDRLDLRLHTLEEVYERAEHWQHQFHVMGGVARKAEAERDRYRADRDLARDVSLMNARMADRYRAALEEIGRVNVEHPAPLHPSAVIARAALEGEE